MLELATRAGSLNRRIFASLPWGFRVAHLFQKLAMDMAEILGRVAYAEFIKAGVVGLPDINGQPALELADKFKGTRAADRLPKGYGKAFGTKAWRIALSKLRNPEVVEEAASLLMSKIIMGKFGIQEGVDLRMAENLVITSLINAGKDTQRNRNRQERSLPQDDEGVALDIEDPRAFKELGDMLPQSEWASILRELERIHDKAPAWVEAQLEGVSGVELAESWGTEPAYIINWKKRYLPAIKEVIYEHLKEAV